MSAVIVPAGGTGSVSPGAPLLELHSITKRYGRVTACDGIDLAIEPGQIRGLLGQNGAGKSTLMKIAAGVVEPDSGQIAVRGEVVPIADPAAAAANGIGMVHQHFSLIGPMPVWKNVTLGDRGRVDRDRSVAEVEHISELYGLEVDPHARVADLTIGQRQRVEIVKCLRREPEVVILDEPTSVLTIAESKALFDILRELIQRTGRGVVLISHRLDEALEAADEITVLRDGRVVSTMEAAAATPNLLAVQMLGREVSLAGRRAPAPSGPSDVGLDGAGPGDSGLDGAEPGASRQGGAGLGDSGSSRAEPDDAGRSGAKPGDSGLAAGQSNGSPPALELRAVGYIAPGGHRLLDGLSLAVSAGEILGVAGVEGNGQAALVDMLSNLIRPDEGRVLVGGQAVEPGRGRSLLEAGVGVIPADRHDSGCVLEMTVAENLVLNRIGAVMRNGVIDQSLLHDRARRLVAEFGIATSSLSAPLGSLSGGNQQRVVLAREVSSRPSVLVAAEPTHGLDVGAMEYLWGRLRAAAAEGAAVLLVSSDLDEILALADRIAVIYRGRIVGEMPGAGVDPEELGLLMGGRAA